MTGKQHSAQATVRITAFSIDVLILISLAFLLHLLVNGLPGSLSDLIRWPVTGVVLLLYYGLFFLVYAGSPGNMLTNTLIIDQKNQKPIKGLNAIYYLLLFILNLLLCGLGFLSSFRKQHPYTLYDKFAHCRCIENYEDYAADSLTSLMQQSKTP